VKRRGGRGGDSGKTFGDSPTGTKIKSSETSETSLGRSGRSLQETLLPPGKRGRDHYSREKSLGKGSGNKGRFRGGSGSRYDEKKDSLLGYWLGRVRLHDKSRGGQKRTQEVCCGGGVERSSIPKLSSEANPFSWGGVLEGCGGLRGAKESKKGGRCRSCRERL